jgi:hypothetical protein
VMSRFQLPGGPTIHLGADPVTVFTVFTVFEAFPGGPRCAVLFAFSS